MALRDPERLDLPSASAFEQLACCPGQPQLLEAVKDKIVEETSEEAEIGIKLHKAWETDNIDDLDEEQAALYKKGVELRATCLQNWYADNPDIMPDGITESRELRLWLHDPDTLSPIASGQLDCHFVSGKHLLDVDFKSLWAKNLSPAYRSWQLRLQAVLGWHEYTGIEQVRVAFLKAMRGKIEHTDYTLEDLRRSEESIRFHLWESKQPEAPRRAGLHCRWCPAKSFCKEATAWGLLPSVASYGWSGKTAVMLPEEIDERIAAMQPQDLVTIWERSGVIDKILDAVKARLKTFSDEDLRALGIARVDGRRLDPIVNTKAAFDSLAEHINPDELWKALKFSKIELQKAVRRDLDWPAEKTRDWLKQKLVDCIEEKCAESSLEKIAV